MHLVFDWSQTFFISLSSPLSCRVLKAAKKKKVYFHFQYTSMVLQVSGKESLLKGRNPTKCEEPSRAQSVPQGQENRPEFHWHMVTFIIFLSLLSLSFPQINLDNKYSSVPKCICGSSSDKEWKNNDLQRFKRQVKGSLFAYWRNNFRIY